MYRRRTGAGRLYTPLILYALTDTDTRIWHDSELSARCPNSRPFDHKMLHFS